LSLVALALGLGLYGSERFSGSSAEDFRAQMREFGIKEAEVEIHFTWILGPTFPKPVRHIYFTNYGFDPPQIADPKSLQKIWPVDGPPVVLGNSVGRLGPTALELSWRFSLIVRLASRAYSVGQFH